VKRTLVFLGLAYIISRSFVITHWPIFFDEAIYVRWAMVVYQDWTWKFVSLIDGKQPLFIWLTAFNLYFIKDAFLAGRLVSFAAGLINVFAIFWIGKKIFGAKTGIMAAFLYIIIPFYEIYDGLALMDTLLMTTALITTVFTLKLFERPNIKYALGLGITAGLGLLTKSSALIYILMIPLALLLVKTYKREEIKKYVGFLAISIFVAKLIESVMRLSIYYPIIAEKNKVFSFTMEELLKMPLDVIFTNFKNIGVWLDGYFGFLIIFSALAIVVVRRNRKVLYLLLNFILPLLVAGVMGKQLYPRYILFMTWPMVILTAEFFIFLKTIIKNKLLWIVSLLIILYPVLYNNWFLYGDIFRLRIPEVERWQFLTGGPSGINLDQVFSFIDSQKGKKILVIADQHNGIIGDSIAAKYFRDKNVVGVGVDGVDKGIIERKTEEVEPDRVYLLLSWQGVPGDIPAELVKEIKRPGKDNNWKIYKVRTE